MVKSGSRDDLLERPWAERLYQISFYLLSWDMLSVARCLMPLLAAFQLGLTLYLCFLRQPGHHKNMASEVATASMYDRNNERPIRPLPKRRLRERLSPEVADSIKYPPAPQSTPALFSYPCHLKGGFEEETSSGGRDFQPEFSSRQSSRRNGARQETDLDEVALRRTVVPRAPTESLSRPARLLQKPDTSRQGQSPQPPPSAASSADGYDSFENTNNKKKRKIPTAGEMNGGHGLGDHGLNDAHSLPGGLAVTPERSGENGNSTSIAYYGSGSFMSTGQNVSGPGRGRFGRARSGRSPLQTLSDTSGNWLGRGSKNRSATWSPQPGKYLSAFHLTSTRNVCLAPLSLMSLAFAPLPCLRHCMNPYASEPRLTFSLYSSAKHRHYF